jgi:phospholipid/cholesterol/gamma-HCH transport system substrate-binding protein
MRGPARNPLEVMSPTMVGALTVLVALVTVYLSYNAGNSLPFVPTYDVAVQVPDAQELNDNNEVLVAGRRVGVIYSIEPRMTEQGHPYAQLNLHLDKAMEGQIHPDATAEVRARSLLGAKYLDLSLGRQGPALQDGATLPRDRSRVEVEVDELLDEFTPQTRRHFQEVLGGLGDGLASRGQDFNDTLTSLRPLVKDSHAVFGEIAAPAARLDRLLRAYTATADELAAQPGDLAGILRSGATTLQAMDDPALDRSIEKSPGTLSTGTDALATLTPVLARARTITARLAPAAKLLPSTAKRLARAGRAGVPALRRARELAKPLEAAFGQLQGLGVDEPSVPAFNQLAGVLPQLAPAVDYLAAYQLNCNYIAIGARNLASTVSEGTASGNWLRFAAVLQPPEMFPTATPAPNLHFDPYPNAGAAGQPNECEAGNEPYLPGRQLGNVPGNQGTRTEDTSPQGTAAVSG